MREIKFRAFHPSQGMCYPDDLYKMTLSLGFDGKIIYDQMVDESLVWVLMQYTGLKDKNGTEIYDGDIVKYKSPIDSGTEEIRWNGEVSTIGYSSQGIQTLMSIDFTFEVIGNIYENQELLEE